MENIVEKEWSPWHCNDFVILNDSAAVFAVFLAVICLIDRDKNSSQRLGLKSLLWDLLVLA